MARLEYVDETSITDERVLEAFERYRKKRGQVSNIYRLLAYCPDILSSIGPFALAVQGPGTLDARFKELVTNRVALAIRAPY